MTQLKVITYLKKVKQNILTDIDAVTKEVGGGVKYGDLGKNL